MWGAQAADRGARLPCPKPSLPIATALSIYQMPSLLILYYMSLSHTHFLLNSYAENSRSCFSNSNLKLFVRTGNGTGQNYLDPTRPVNFKIFLTGQVDLFFTEGFCSLLNAFNQKFSKGGGGAIGEVLKLVSTCGGLRKKYAKITQF